MDKPKAQRGIIIRLDADQADALKAKLTSEGRSLQAFFEQHAQAKLAAPINPASNPQPAPQKADLSAEERLAQAKTRNLEERDLARAHITPTAEFEAKYPRIDHPSNRLPPGVVHVSELISEDWLEAMAKRVMPKLQAMEAERYAEEGPLPIKADPYAERDRRLNDWVRDNKRTNESPEQAAQRFYKERDALNPRTPEPPKTNAYQAGRDAYRANNTPPTPEHLKSIPPAKHREPGEDQ